MTDQNYDMRTTGTVNLVPEDDDVKVHAPVNTVNLDKEFPETHDTVYDDVIDALSRPTDIEPLRLPIPLRPGVGIIVDCAFSWDELQLWTKKATDRRAGELKPKIMAEIILSNRMVGLTMNGQQVYSKKDPTIPLTFTTPEFWEMMKCKDTRTAMSKCFGNDGHMISAMGEVMERSGYSGVDWEAEDSETPLD